jgi:rhomboid protease GluP
MHTFPTHKNLKTMSFGLTPNSTIDIGLDHLTPGQFLVLCLDIVAELGWDVRYTSESGFIAITTKKMFKRKQKITLRMDGDIANLQSESIDSELYDRGANRRNVQQFYDLLSEKRSAVSVDDLSTRFETLRSQLAPTQEDILQGPPPTSAEKRREFFALFLPRPGYTITPILIDINIGVFLLMALSGVSILLPGTHSLIQWGANIRYLTLDHQWWRLFTCCFVHIGILHLLLNMYALLYIGILLEPRLGSARFLSAYLLTGVMASLASLYWHTHTASAGASGAIFGMYGVFLALLTTNLIPKAHRTPLFASIGIFVGYNLLAGTRAGVDNAAHIGGVLSGFIIGYLFYPGLRQTKPAVLQYGGIALAALGVITTSIVALKTIPNDFRDYEAKMKLFGRYENRAINILKSADDYPSKEQWAGAIRDSGIYDWRQCLGILRDLDAMKLNPLAKRRNAALVDYCNLRIASYNYDVEKLGGQVPSGEDSTRIYNTELSAVMKRLKDLK